MIDAKQIMIGNLLSYNNRLCRVSCIYITHFRCVDIETSIDYGDSIRNNYNPIPLSEEILLKCGFEFIYGEGQNDSSYAKKNNENKIIFQITDRFTFRHSSYNRTTINYLHELQQLYKILTKQELEIKL